jgi:hypothetical protein
MLRVLRQFSAAADLLRPRALLRTLARVDQVVDSTRELRVRMEALQVRTDQLMTIERLDWELRDDIQLLPQLLDANRVRKHVECAVQRTPIDFDPCPHIVVHDWLPADVYKAMIRAIPPAVFFADRDPRRQRLIVPFDLAPTFSQRVWRFLSAEVIDGSLRDAMNAKFGSIVSDYVDSFCPSRPDDLDLALQGSDGRIMLRRPGYVIEPHRDPKWGFLTGLVYLARKGDNEAHGTRLYRVADDVAAPSDKPYYIDPSRCALVKTVPFKANTLLVFMNNTGAHAASIPADEQPVTLERYVYQFRLGPDTQTIARLLSLMTPAGREAWGGVKSVRAESYVRATDRVV